MEQIKILEMVLWKPIENISIKKAKQEITKLNDFVSKQPGFLGRKTAIATDGKFLDIVYWADITSAKNASEKAMLNKEVMSVFNTIDQKEMIFQHFEVFNKIE